MIGTRCDICDVEGRAAKVRRFNLVTDGYTADGRSTTRGAGALELCERCWRNTAGKRLRKLSRRQAA